MFKFAQLSVVAAVAAFSVPVFAETTPQTAGMAAPAAAASATTPASANIIETATKAGQFTTLAKAIEAAGLTETLKGPGPFTVFAPTDAAFAKVPADALADLMKPENKAKLADLLKLHVVSGKVTAAEVSKMDSAKSLAGADLTVKVEGSNVMIQNAKVSKADVMASNGVIHVIDTVIMPAE